MGFLEDNCTFAVLSKDLLESCNQFDCGHGDLNDFFTNDSQNYSSQLLGKSYCFLLDENPQEIVCAFTISNDSIKTNFLPNSRKKKVNKEIPRVKQFRSYPAVLIGRLGVSDKFKKNGIGRELMDFIKSWFIDPENKISRVFIGGADGPPIMLKQTSADLASGNYEYLLKSAQQEIRNSLPETEDDRLAFHFTMVERALVRLREFAQ